MKLYVIPNINEIDKWNQLSKENDLGFEYNDFFYPNVLDDEEKLISLIEKYKSYNRYNDTLHGVFFDINFASVDEEIKKISYKRAKQSLDIAVKLNCKAVIFHTNYQTWIKSDGYRTSWVKESLSAYKNLLAEYPNMNIYVENMFDDDPFLLQALANSLKDEPRFGVCLDAAHAHISSTPLDVWFESLLPFIKHIHLNDNDKTDDSHLALKEGNIDYHYILKTISKINDVTVLLEMNKYDDVVKSLKIVKEVIS